MRYGVYEKVKKCRCYEYCNQLKSFIGKYSQKILFRLPSAPGNYKGFFHEFLLSNNVSRSKMLNPFDYSYENCQWKIHFIIKSGINPVLWNYRPACSDRYNKGLKQCWEQLLPVNNADSLTVPVDSFVGVPCFQSVKVIR